MYIYHSQIVRDIQLLGEYWYLTEPRLQELLDLEVSGNGSSTKIITPMLMLMEMRL